jgi:hypothetical protein
MKAFLRMLAATNIKLTISNAPDDPFLSIRLEKKYFEK